MKIIVGCCCWFFCCKRLQDRPTRGKPEPVHVCYEEKDGRLWNWYVFRKWLHVVSAGHSHLGCYRLSGCCCYWGSWRGQRPPRWCRPWDWGFHPVMTTHCSPSRAMCWSGCPMTSSASLLGRRSSSCSAGPLPLRRPRNPPPRLRRSAAVVASGKGTRNHLVGWPTRSPRCWISSSPSCAPSACRRWRRPCPSWRGRTCWLSGCSGWTGRWPECLLVPSPSSPS